MQDEGTPKGQALEVWAAPNEIGVHGADGHLADTWESGTFAFEPSGNGTPVTDIQELQRPQVGQPNQGVDKLCHQIFWGLLEV
jgi:hypothetical protein